MSCGSDSKYPPFLASDLVVGMQGGCALVSLLSLAGFVARIAWKRRTQVNRVLYLAAAVGLSLTMGSGALFLINVDRTSLSTSCSKFSLHVMAVGTPLVMATYFLFMIANGLWFSPTPFSRSTCCFAGASLTMHMRNYTLAMALVNALYGGFAFGYEFQKNEHNDYPINLLLDWLIAATYLMLQVIYLSLTSALFLRAFHAARSKTQNLAYTLYASLLPWSFVLVMASFVLNFVVLCLLTQTPPQWKTTGIVEISLAVMLTTACLAILAIFLFAGFELRPADEVQLHEVDQ
jgi:hypothetical protein